MVKNLPEMQETWDRLWIRETPLGKGMATQVALVVKNPPASAGDVRVEGSVPGSGRCPRGGHGSPLQCS